MLTIGNTSLSIFTIFQIIFSLMLVILIGKVFKRILKDKLLHKLNIDHANRETLANIINYSTGCILFIVFLQYLGVNISTLAVIGGGLGLGIGFALQDLIKDFISGLTLLFERPIKAGDFIEIEGSKGYVKEISTRSIIIETQDGSDIFIPNSYFINSRFTNWSYQSFTARIIVPISVAYQSDLILLTELLLQCAHQESKVLLEPSPEVLFIGFGDNSLNFELRVWIDPIDEEPEIRSHLNFLIESLLRENHINIPFPQRDVWLKNAPEKNISILETKKISVKEILKKVEYFQDFNQTELRQLIQSGYRRNLQESEILFKENDLGDAFYIVLSGSVEVFVEKINKHLTDLNVGSFFGELSLILGIPRTATVKAKEKTVLFCINHHNFKKLLNRNPNLYDLIIMKLSERENELIERQKELRNLGLIDSDEDDNNPLIWVKKRIQKIFMMEEK